MTADYIKMCVANYFRFQRGCPIVALEYWHYRDCCVQPDVLVVDAANRPIEIEVKTSLSDFRADGKKGIWRFRNRGNRWPWKFYFAVPRELEDRVKPILPGGCGLLRVHAVSSSQPGRNVTVAATAPAHSDHEEMTDAKMKRIIAGMSASLCGALRKKEGSGVGGILIWRKNQQAETEG